MQHCTKQAIAIRLECYQICVTLVALTGSDVKRSWLFFADFHFCCLLCRVQFRWKAISSGHLLNLGCPFQKAAVKCSLLTSFSLYPLLLLLSSHPLVYCFVICTLHLLCHFLFLDSYLLFLHLSSFSAFHPTVACPLPFIYLLQHKRHAQTTTKYVELIIVADNREVSRGQTSHHPLHLPADFQSKEAQRPDPKLASFLLRHR